MTPAAMQAAREALAARLAALPPRSVRAIEVAAELRALVAAMMRAGV